MMARRTHADRRADRELRAAELLLELADRAGVNESPSTVRHALAGIVGAELSHASVDRLVVALEARRARVTS